MGFKAGQTVEVVNNSGMVASLGATAVVKRVYKFCNHDLIDVVWKTDFNNQMDGGYHSYHFEYLLRKNEQLLFSFMSAMDGT